MGPVIFLVVFLGSWFWLAKYWMRHGHNKALSVIGSGLLAFFAAGMLGTAADGGFKDAQRKQAPDVATAPVKQSAPATPPASSVSASATEKPGERKAAAAPSLGMPLSEYTKRFNVIAKQLDSRYRLRPTRKVDNSLGAERFNATLTDGMTVSGVLTSTGEISMVSLIASQTNDTGAAADQMLMILATLTAASKDATTRDLGPTIGDLVSEAAANLKLHNEHFGIEHAFNGVNFSLVRMEGVNMYSAQPVDK